jgi:hypothetical protein
MTICCLSPVAPRVPLPRCGLNRLRPAHGVAGLCPASLGSMRCVVDRHDVHGIAAHHACQQVHHDLGRGAP